MGKRNSAGLGAILITLGIILVSLLIVGGIWWYFDNDSKDEIDLKVDTQKIYFDISDNSKASLEYNGEKIGEEKFIELSKGEEKELIIFGGKPSIENSFYKICFRFVDLEDLKLVDNDIIPTLKEYPLFLSPIEYDIKCYDFKNVNTKIILYQSNDNILVDTQTIKIDVWG